MVVSRWSLGSIRFRITAIAAAAVALVLSVAAVTLVVVQRQQTVSNLDAGLVSRAMDIEALLSSNAETPDVISAARGEAFVQIVDDGRVLVGNPPITEPIVALAVPPARLNIETYDGLVIDDDAFRVLTMPVQTAEGSAVLLLGRSLDEVTDGVATLAASLAIAIPAVVIALTLIVWWLVGRTLAPVEAIRVEVAEIGATHLDHRVPLPTSRDEIRRLAETMNDMLDRIENAVGRQQQFVADASHELRSPLARIRTELQVDPVDEATIESAREELVGLQNLVSDLLQLARFDAEESPRPGEVVDLDDLVFREGNNAMAEGIGVDMSAVAAVQTHGNRQQLGRAVRNLVENARSHADALISLSLYQEGDTAVITVTDDGSGIPETQRELVFERFARLDDARSHDTGGTGLGLAIAREIVERHDGTISIDPGYVDGARFVMRLPAYH